MCGICGTLALNGPGLSEKNLEEMMNALRHRGPDDHGRFIRGPVALGFRRLSIVDLSGGHQPMSNEDGTIWIAFNGEIYNHPELRSILQKRGHRYASNSDTETILHLYEEYGVDCVRHLRGMFAFAIWDIRGRKLFCARDRLGIKPFYYTVCRDRFAFASEIKAFLRLPGFMARLDRRALPEFLAFGYLASDGTLFDGVRKLLPGHILQIELVGRTSTPQITRYWDVNISPTEERLDERKYVEQFHELFTDAVQSHLMSDVPVGVFLSGGLDSSAIASTMSSLRKAPIATFSIGYAEDQYSELGYARQVAKHIGAEHHEMVLGPNELLESLPKLIWHEDEPIAWPSSVALHHVSRLASKKVKVVLTGEGGDELFAGYLKYRATLWNLRAAPIYRNLTPNAVQELIQRALKSEAAPDWIQRKLRHSFLYYPPVFEKIYFDNFYSVFPQNDQPQILNRKVYEEVRDVHAYANSMKFFPASKANGDLLGRLLYLDIKTYLVELLMKQDQMSMAASIESRVPFLDHKLVEWAARLPANEKVGWFSGKRLLRRAMAGKLPDAVLQRTKKGFPTPIRPWLRNQLFDKLSTILTDGRMEERQLFQAGYVHQLLNAHRRGHSWATEGCWRLLNFELWSRVFLDGDDMPLASQMSHDRPAVTCNH